MLFDTRDSVSWWLRVVAVALSVAIVITGGLLVGWNAFFSQFQGERYVSNGGADLNNSSIVEGEGDEGETLAELEPVDSGDSSDMVGEPIHPAELSNLKSNIKSWLNTGEAVHDSNVINILLIGMDDDYKENLSTKGRADAMMILSINQKTKAITLASLMRDQYAYIVANGKGSFQKLHHSLNWGPSVLIQMVERYYKITIDNYVIVNFASVAHVIDALGGVTLDIEANEASYLRNTCGWTNVIPAGASSVHVSGAYALTYMRIRKGNTGGDVARTGRQRKVIMKLIDEAKNCSVKEIVNIVNTMIPYVRTGLSSTEMLSYATTAVTSGWLNYEIKQVTLPVEGKSAKGFTNSEDNLWYWKVDFPVAAQELQMALYGKSNIELSSKRKSWLS